MRIICKNVLTIDSERLIFVLIIIPRGIKVKRIFLSFILMTMMVFFSFAGGAKEQSGNISVVTTTSIAGDVVSQVVGDKVELTILMKRGANPHSYEPTPKDMAAVESADVVFVSGVGLEESLLESLENVSANVMSLSDGVDINTDFEDHDEDEHDHHDEGEDHDEDEHEHHEEEHHHHHAEGDPHVWMSPINVIVWVQNVEKTMSELDPANSDYYAANADAYIEKLYAVDKEIQDAYSAIPEADRVLITDHDAFGYYATRYHLSVIGTVVSSFSDNSESSAKDLKDLVNIMEEHKVSALYLGNTSSDSVKDLTTTLKNELSYTVDIKELLTGSLTEEGGDADNYLDFLRFNTKQIIDGLSK